MAMLRSGLLHVDSTQSVHQTSQHSHQTSSIPWCIPWCIAALASTACVCLLAANQALQMTNTSTSAGAELPSWSTLQFPAGETGVVPAITDVQNRQAQAQVFLAQATQLLDQEAIGQEVLQLRADMTRYQSQVANLSTEMASLRNGSTGSSQLSQTPQTSSNSQSPYANQITFGTSNDNDSVQIREGSPRQELAQMREELTRQRVRYESIIHSLNRSHEESQGQQILLMQQAMTEMRNVSHEFAQLRGQMGRSSGWSLVIKSADNGDDRLDYASALWTNSALHNQHSPVDEMVNAKYQAFNDVAFNKIRLCVGNPDSNCLEHTLSHRYDSARTLFSGDFVPEPSLNQDEFLRVFGVIQGTYHACRMQKPGFNSEGAGNNKARLGYFGNHFAQPCQLDGGDTDWAIGIGLHGQYGTPVGSGWTGSMMATSPMDPSVPKPCWLWVNTL